MTSMASSPLYRVYSYKDEAALEHCLNRLHKEGYNLDHMFQRPDGTMLVILKRERPVSGFTTNY